MALVDGMGEAVLPYGDGIASEGRVQDCSVFGGKIKDIFVKDVRYEKAPLISGEYKPQTRERHGPSVAEVGVRIEDILATADDGQDPCCPEPARSMSGQIGHVSMNGHVNGLEKEEEGDEKNGGEAAKWKPAGTKRPGSRVLQSGSTECDSIVESVIQSLDEKVDKATLTEEALQLLWLVPEGYTPLPHQVGGHRHVEGKLGFLQKIGQPELLYKPVQPGFKGQTERQFYESLFGSRILSQEMAQLKSLVPLYYGLETIRDRAGHLHEFLKLEDITHRFKRPCILDLKVGRRVWDDFAEPDKIEREKKKFPAQETLGYRIIGMRIYQPSSGEYMYFDKFYGRSVREDTAMQAVSNFFVCREVNRSDVIPVVLEKLSSFLCWFQRQTSLRLFATSLLIIYEGDHAPGSAQKPSVDIRLVDFAHTYKHTGNGEDPDENWLFGLENFTRCLMRLKREIAAPYIE